MPEFPDIAIVLIGRNEGERLKAALTSVKSEGGMIVYVDSGSSDGSVSAARAAGAEVLELDGSTPFTAARARNAGASRALNRGDFRYIQFIDGDCALQPGWLATAHSFLEATPRASVACGRRRERFPEASIYNRLCDWEWNTPVGQAKACGGDALMRVAAFQEVGGFDSSMIAGEEPELCLRMRRAGWEIWRLDAEMTLHDAAMTRFSQWWKRSRRTGWTWAEGAAMHGSPPEGHGVAELRRAVLWGGALPTLALLGTFATTWSLLFLLAYPAQILRLWRKGGGGEGAFARALFLTFGKIPEAMGVVDYALARILGGRKALIEYK